MILLNTSTNNVAFTGFTQKAKDWIYNELSDLDNPVFLYQMRIIYPTTVGSTNSVYNYGGLDSLSEGEEWIYQKDILWFNSMNASSTDKYILLPLGLSQSDILGPTYSPKVKIEDGQYTYQLRMIPVGEGVIEQLTGIVGPTTEFPNGPTMSYSNQSPWGWTQSWSDKREIVTNSYLLEVGRLLVVSDPILTREEKPLGYDNGVWDRKDDDEDVYL